MNNQLTMDNMKKLQEELEYRMTTLRGEIAKEKLIAAAHGDRSENAEYKAACENYRNNDKRIQYLLTMLSTATVIDESDSEEGVLAVNRSARVLFLDDDEEVLVKLVTTVERDPERMAVSIESDLGKALLGRRAEDVLEISAPGGKYSVKIIEVINK